MARTVKTIALLLLIVVTASSQEKGKWVFAENKDEMTDKVTRMVALSEKDIGFSANLGLAVSKVGDSCIIGLALPLHLTADSLTVQWRIDELPMVEESWMIVGKGIGTINNQTLLKAMVTGKTLRIRLKAGSTTTTILEFDVRGLSYYLPKLGITVD